MNRYVTTAELKTYLGISGSGQDTLLDLLSRQAHGELNDILGVTDLALHKVVNEIHDGRGTWIDTNDINVVAVDEITMDGTEYTQTDAYDIDDYRVHLTDALTGGDRKAKITYAAGWNASGMAVLTVTVASLSPTATITFGDLTGAVSGGALTRGTAWAVQTTDEAEATAIAAAITATAYARAFAIGNQVYIIEDGGASDGVTPGLTGRSITTSDSTKLALSSSTLTGVDFPEALRGAVMTMVAGRFATRKSKGVKSYTIGSKTVTLASGPDAESQAEELRRAIRAYARVKVAATKSRSGTW